VENGSGADLDKKICQDLYRLHKWLPARLKVDFATWLSFLALLSISLGAINLLPIPVLDGGHIVFHALEGDFWSSRA